MSTAIWKHAFSLDFAQTVAWPGGARVIHADVQDGKPTVWFVCDPEAGRVDRRFWLLPTGQLPGTAERVITEEKHVASFLLDDGHLVAHLFEEVLF